MPKRPDDISRFCWNGACDDCLDGKCRCDHHLVDGNAVVYGKWTAADLARIQAMTKTKLEVLAEIVD